MQMVNIFNEITIIDKFFKNDPINLKIKTRDLFDYLYDNLENENMDILKFDLRNALSINANGKYIY
jgi:membrane-bound lytic murein transglycosylase MltF